MQSGRGLPGPVTSQRPNVQAIWVLAVIAAVSKSAFCTPTCKSGLLVLA